MAVRSTQEVLLISAPGSPGKVRSTQEVLLISIPYTPMGIIYPLSPPAITGLGPQDFTMTEVNVVGETESPFTLGQQIQQWAGQALQIEANLPPMLLAQAEQWIGFLGSLMGKFGTFLMGDYNRPTPQGAISGSPVVSGLNLSGINALNLRGATPGVSNWAVAGDYVQATLSGYPQRIYKVLQNAASDGSGNVALSVFPNLRETLLDGNAITTSNCQGTFRLQENTFKWTIDKDRKYAITFKAKESI